MTNAEVEGMTPVVGYRRLLSEIGILGLTSLGGWVWCGGRNGARLVTCHQPGMA